MPRAKFRSMMLLVAIVLLGRVCVGAAGTATTSLTVSATVVDACTVTTTPLAFPPYASGTTTPTDTTSTIAVLCTPGTAFTVGLNPGSTTGSAFVERRMQHVTSASATLGYNIYRNAERTEVWADGIGSTFTVSGTGTGLQHVVSFTAYGRMPSGQRVSFGTYTDVITVTLTY